MAGLGGDWMDSIIDTFLATGSASALMHVLVRALTHSSCPYLYCLHLAIILGRRPNHSRLNRAGLRVR
jgi:hypothetical protein